MGSSKRRDPLIAPDLSAAGIVSCQRQLDIAVKFIDEPFKMPDANVDILLGLKNRFNLQDVLEGRMKLKDVVVYGPAGIKVIPGSSGIPRIANMSSRKRQEFIASFKELEEEADIILVDTSAGMTKNVINFALLADDIILVTTPEPSAITDAYAMIKVILTGIQ